MFWATFLTGCLLGGAGAFTLLKAAAVRANLVGWTRSMRVALVVFGVAGLWFLWHVWNLGDADFGNFRVPLMVLFSGTIIGSFFYVRDLLAARGAAVLALLVSLELLKSAYMHYDAPQRLLLVVFAYALIVGGIVYGAMPWRLRDALTWLARADQRVSWLGRVAVGYGALLVIVSLTY